MAKFQSNVKGKLMEIKTTKKNKPYLVVYSEGKVTNVLLEKNEDVECFAVGQDVAIPVEIIADNAFVKMVI
jgi:hypothetical protein